jgi:hypothetical protein
MADSTLPRRESFVAGKVLVLTLIVLAVALAAGLAQTSAGTFLLRKAGLAAVPASYTSLAFTAPQSLPARLAHARSLVRISFAVGNASAGPRSYHWTIAADHAGHATWLAAGDVRVPAHGRTAVTRTVTVRCAQGQVRITAGLATPAESVDFQAACSS